jgi:hypothetical protein
VQAFASGKVGVGGFEKSGPWASDLVAPADYCCFLESPPGHSGSGCIKSEFGETYL